MSNESSMTASSPGLRAASPSASPADSYIGSFISLTSKYEIRYEGILYYLNPQDSTLGLKNVKSYGTEGRKKDGPQIPPNDKVYEYILFRGSDIKDLQVKSSPPSQDEVAIQNDPAIIQSQGVVGPSSSSKSVLVGVESLTQSNFYQEPPVLTSRAYPEKLVSYQPGTPLGPGGLLQATQNVNAASLHMPIYRPGYSGILNNVQYALQQPKPLKLTPASASLPVMMQNPVQSSATLTSTAMGMRCSSDIATVPSLTTSSSGHLDIAHTLVPEYHSTSSILPSSLPEKASLPSHPSLLTSNRVTVSPFPLSFQHMDANRMPLVGKADSDSVVALPNQSLPCSASIPNSTLSPLLKETPILVTPDQLAQLRPPLLSSMESACPAQEDMCAPNSVSPNLSTSISIPAAQAPLLPLPSSGQQFTEEFDFEAMNEKFKKDEVWGHLGGKSQRHKMEGYVDNAVGQNLGHEGGYGLYGSASKPDPKPAYNKDDFFDTLSCNSQMRGQKDVQSRYSQRMKLDTEGAYPGYGGYGAGWVENYHSSYNWGREYNHGGRCQRGNLRI